MNIIDKSEASTKTTERRESGEYGEGTDAENIQALLGDTSLRSSSDQDAAQLVEPIDSVNPATTASQDEAEHPFYKWLFSGPSFVVFLKRLLVAIAGAVALTIAGFVIIFISLVGFLRVIGLFH